MYEMEAFCMRHVPVETVDFIFSTKPNLERNVSGSLKKISEKPYEILICLYNVESGEMFIIWKAFVRFFFILVYEVLHYVKHKKNKPINNVLSPLLDYKSA